MADRAPRQNSNVNEDRSATGPDYTTHQEHRQALAQNQNAISKPRTQRSVKSKSSLEYATPPQTDPKPASNDRADVSGASSENDSLLDLYNSNDDRRRTTSRDRHRIKGKGSRGAATVLEETPEEPDSKWIHRDKLAQIESRELAEMGVRVGRPSRASSKKSVKTSKSSVDAGDIAQDEQAFDEYPMPDGKRQRQMGPSDANQDDANPDKPPEEHKSQLSQDSITMARPGTSRIPVPNPIAQSGPTPNGNSGSPATLGLRRKRSTSASAYQKTRSRSRSGGSQHLLNMSSDTDSPQAATGETPSSSRSKLPSKETPLSWARASSNARKTSAQQRSVSGSNAASKDSPKRPTTSSGSRPATARPEGEAPWIATMYKPDPRLPPEQQMLPTHAKRIAQMQQGADTQSDQQDEFTLLPDTEDLRPDGEAQEPGFDRSQEESLHGVRQHNSRRASSDWQQQHRVDHAAEQRESGQWPLRTPSGHKIYQDTYQPPQRDNDHQQRSPRPSSPSQNPIKTEPEIWVSGKNSIINAAEHGGYGLMPATNVNSSGGALNVNTNAGLQRGAGDSQQQRASARMSTRSRMSEKEKELEEAAVHAPVNQPVRLKEDREDDGAEGGKKKKGGCGGCCVVM